MFGYKQKKNILILFLVLYYKKNDFFGRISYRESGFSYAQMKKKSQNRNLNL